MRRELDQMQSADVPIEQIEEVDRDCGRGKRAD
jgi:hypothetical protein